MAGMGQEELFAVTQKANTSVPEGKELMWSLYLETGFGAKQPLDRILRMWTGAEALGLFPPFQVKSPP